MRAILLLAVVDPCLLTPSLAADSAGPPRTAIERSLTFLADDALDWKAGRGCATCHHAPMLIWTLSEAKTLGYRVNDAALAEILTWVVDPDDKAKTYPPKRKPEDPKILSLSPLNHALALGMNTRESNDVRAGWERFLNTLVADQHDDGAWRQGTGGRPPMNGTPGVMTAWTLLALTPPGEVQLKDSVIASRKKGLEWLETNPVADDFREEALRLILQSRTRSGKIDRDGLIRQLLARQNKDGGWSQTSELPSDAYSTGLTMYALAVIRTALKTDTFDRAQQFLISTQCEDGSWPMASRSVGEYPPSKDLRPIIYAGSAWATLGLMRSVVP